MPGAWLWVRGGLVDDRTNIYSPMQLRPGSAHTIPVRQYTHNQAGRLIEMFQRQLRCICSGVLVFVKHRIVPSTAVVKQHVGHRCHSGST
jgi:hypothetical protein